MRRGPLRVGVVSAYPPRRDGFAEDARDLVRSLAVECEVSVAAVGRPGLNYPTEVVVAAGMDELADYRRAARVLAEHGTAAVVIRYAEGMYGGPHGAHILDLAQELRRQAIPHIVSLLTVAGGCAGGLDPYRRGSHRRCGCGAGADGDLPIGRAGQTGRHGGPGSGRRRRRAGVRAGGGRRRLAEGLRSRTRSPTHSATPDRSSRASVWQARPAPAVWSQRSRP